MQPPALTALTAALAFCSLASVCSAKENTRAVDEAVRKIENCVIQSTFSFLYPVSRPPKTGAELKQLCKSQEDGLKCLKEKSKGSPAIIRRGILSFVSNRQRHHRKHCTNVESEQSRRLVAATRCAVEKKFEAFRETDAELIQSLSEIERRNYTDPTAELKQICCSFYAHKKTFLANIEPECAAHREALEELIKAISADELNLVCEDEDRLAKVCPTVEPLKFKRVQNYTSLLTGRSAAGLAMYLITTLGETN